MKKDLLTILNLLGFTKFQTHNKRRSNLDLIYNLILISLIFCGVLQACNLPHPFTANRSSILPPDLYKIIIEDLRASEVAASELLVKDLYSSRISTNTHLNFNSIQNFPFLKSAKI